MSKVLEEVSLWLLEEVLVWFATSATDDDIKQERQQIEAKRRHKSYRDLTASSESVVGGRTER